MKALIKKTRGFGNVELMDIKEPKCTSMEIKISVKSVGVCGTDLHIHAGNFPYYNPPVILGHEFSGEIADIGKDVQNTRELKIGDRVVVLPSTAITCGTCEYCKSGNFIFCPSRRGMGHGVNGAMTEFVCVREDMVYRLPENISFEGGALIEPLSCCIQSVDDFVNILPTDICLVSGSGTIGLMITALLKLRNCTVVLAGISNDEKRFRIGQKLGADLIVNVDKKDIGKSLLDKFGARTFDKCFECSGVDMSLNNCINNLRKMGSLVQVGLSGKKSSVDVDSIVTKQLAIFGSLGFTLRSWDKSLQLLKESKIVESFFITHRYKLANWETAFNQHKERDSIKVMIEPT